MADEEQRLIEEARRSREETERLREGETSGDAGGHQEDKADEAGNPWAKTSSGNADSITEDD